ncbi:MAG: hypothetical protein NTY19_43315 [Planctomycetota bacterium]|nr:hypothetical protein [Planctomycetota bacterium]
MTAEASRYQVALDAAVDAAREAGKLIRDDFHGPGGPRGSGSHAEVDEEAEQVIRKKILAVFPAAYRGEETGTTSGGDTEHTWLVDPNDGTSAYLKGWRGSAVSIALVRQGVLVLGVVYAPCYPDDNGDLFAWAEGCGPVMRNGKPVTTSLVDKNLKLLCGRGMISDDTEHTLMVAQSLLKDSCRPLRGLAWWPRSRCPVRGPAPRTRHPSSAATPSRVVQLHLVADSSCVYG